MIDAATTSDPITINPLLALIAIGLLLAILLLVLDDIFKD